MSGGAPQQDTYAQNKQAAVSREMYDYWRGNFQSGEQQLITEMNDPALVTGTVAKAKSVMGMSLDASDAAQTREAGRYGISMTPDRVKSTTRGNDLTRGLATVAGANTARRGVDKYKTDVINGVGSLGRQTAGDAMQGFNTVASMESSRNQTNRANAAANDAAMQGAAGTMFGAGAAMMV